MTKIERQDRNLNCIRVEVGAFGLFMMMSVGPGVNRLNLEQCFLPCPARTHSRSTSAVAQ
jgi:hypothetical protein